VLLYMWYNYSLHFLPMLAEVLFDALEKCRHLFRSTGPCRGGLYARMPSEMMVWNHIVSVGGEGRPSWGSWGQFCWEMPGPACGCCLSAANVAGEAGKSHSGDLLVWREALEKTSPAKGTLLGLCDRWIELFRLKLIETFNVRHYAFRFTRTEVFWAVSL